MKFFLIYIFVIFYSNSLIAGIFDSETKIKAESCDSKDFFVIYTYSLSPDSTKVFEKTEIFYEKKLRKTELNQLDNCIIKDNKNWKCGGEKIYFINQTNGIRTAQIDTIKQVIDGKYYIKRLHYEVNGIEEKENKTCEKLTQY